MITLKVVSYYDAWLGKNIKSVLLEKEGILYDASGLFTKLDDYEISNMRNIDVLYQEELNYCDRSIEEQEELLQEISRLEKEYNIEQFGDSTNCKHYWVYVNGVSNIKSYQ